MNFEDVPREQVDSTLALLFEKELIKNCDQEGCPCEGKNYAPTEKGLWVVIESVLIVVYDMTPEEARAEAPDFAAAILQGGADTLVEQQIAEQLDDIDASALGQFDEPE